jgi:hypothetical protein
LDAILLIAAPDMSALAVKNRFFIYDFFAFCDDVLLFAEAER